MQNELVYNASVIREHGTTFFIEKQIYSPLVGRQTSVSHSRWVC